MTAGSTVPHRALGTSPGWSPQVLTGAARWSSGDRAQLTGCLLCDGRRTLGISGHGHRDDRAGSRDRAGAVSAGTSRRTRRSRCHRRPARRSACRDHSWIAGTRSSEPLGRRVAERPARAGSRSVVPGFRGLPGACHRCHLQRAVRELGSAFGQRLPRTRRPVNSMGAPGTGEGRGARSTAVWRIASCGSC